MYNRFLEKEATMLIELEETLISKETNNYLILLVMEWSISVETVHSLAFY